MRDFLLLTIGTFLGRKYGRYEILYVTETFILLRQAHYEVL